MSSGRCEIKAVDLSSIGIKDPALPHSFDGMERDRNRS
jgi:hypothetical protein